MSEPVLHFYKDISVLTATHSTQASEATNWKKGAQKHKTLNSFKKKKKVKNGDENTQI